MSIISINIVEYGNGFGPAPGGGSGTTWLTHIMDGAETRGMAPGAPMLVARMYVDLLRVGSAICLCA